MRSWTRTVLIGTLKIIRVNIDSAIHVWEGVAEDWGKARGTNSG
jgi:hypothetical protein